MYFRSQIMLCQAIALVALGSLSLALSQKNRFDWCLENVECVEDDECLEKTVECLNSEDQQGSDEVYDLCIVGAGLFGSAAARHASANADLKVCLVGPEEPTESERASREIFGSHYDEGRIMALDVDDPALLSLAHASVDRLADLERLSGIRFYVPIGMLMVGAKNSSITIEGRKAAYEYGLNNLDITSNGVLQQRFPYLKIDTDVNAALLTDHRAGYLSPRGMIAAQKKVSRQQGCDLIDDVVEEVEELRDGTHRVFTEQNGILKCKRVLITAGGFSNFKKLLPKKIEMFVVRELAALIRIPPEEAKRLSSMPTMSTYEVEDEATHADDGNYILPPILYPDGHYYLKIGHESSLGYPSVQTLEEARKWYLSKGNASLVETMVKRLQNLIPDLKIEEVKPVTCITSDSPTGVPYIDRLTPTWTLAAVGNSVGATIAEEVGRIAAELSIHGKWDGQMDKDIYQVIYQEQ